MSGDEAAIEAVARALAELRIRTVRKWDTEPAALEAGMERAVDYNWKDFADQARAAINAYLEAKSAEGWRMMPRELSDDAANLGADFLYTFRADLMIGKERTTNYVRALHRAMFDASPPSNTGEAGGT